MTTYSLIEHKLRRYFYLGHEHSMYILSSLKLASYKKHEADVFGVRIIGKIVKKNKPEEINSIVPIILKVKKEGTLHDDTHLIFALAVCAGFEIEQCVKMVDDALAAILTVCSNALQLLIFVKHYETAVSLLKNEGYLSKDSTFSNKFRKALCSWYLSNNPVLLTEQICKYWNYDKWNHKKVFKLIHFHSDEQSFKMIIFYVIYGMKRVKEEFETIVKDVQIKDIYELHSNKQLKFMYSHFEAVNNLKKMDVITLRNEIEMNCLGKQFEIIPKNMLSSSMVLTALIKNMSMRNILDLTFVFAKRRVFYKQSPENGLREYILSFANQIALKESCIHPIESFIEYVKYSRTHLNNIKFQNMDSNKLSSWMINLPIDKINTIYDISNPQSDGANSEVVKTTLNESDKNTVQSVVKDANKNQASSSNPKEDINLRLKNIKLTSNSSDTNKDESLEQKSDSNDISQNNAKIKMIVSKPLPKLEEEMLTFLSVDLVRRTLENLNPSGHHIVITYDCRMYLKIKKCACTPLLNIHEAITLIILSLIYPEPLSNKPSIRRLDGSKEQRNKEVQIDYQQPMTVNSLDSVLFKAPANVIFNEKNLPNVNPLSTMNWAITNNKKFDIFVFLGSHKMNVRKIEQVKKKYQEYLKKTVKIIVCCLDGMHVDQSALYRQNVLFIAGFDKNVGKIINSFIHNEF